MSAAKPTSRPPDRRQRKSRTALQQALLHLVAVKPYETITIEDIADAADVTRQTFYAHYPDKTALLRELCDQLLSELFAAVRAVVPTEEPVFSGAGVAEVLRHAKTHSDLYRVVLSGAAGSEPRAALTAAMVTVADEIFSSLSRPPGHTPPVPISFTAGTFVAALLYTVEGALGRRVRGSPTEIAEMFIRAQVGGVAWALGLEDNNVRRPSPE